MRYIIKQIDEKNSEIDYKFKIIFVKKSILQSKITSESSEQTKKAIGEIAFPAMVEYFNNISRSRSSKKKKINSNSNNNE